MSQAALRPREVQRAPVSSVNSKLLHAVQRQTILPECLQLTLGLIWCHLVKVSRQELAGAFSLTYALVYCLYPNKFICIQRNPKHQRALSQLSTQLINLIWDIRKDCFRSFRNDLQKKKKTQAKIWKYQLINYLPRSKSKNKKLRRREKPIASHIKSLKYTKVRNLGTETMETIRRTKEIQTVIRVSSRQVTNESWVQCVILQNWLQRKGSNCNRLTFHKQKADTTKASLLQTSPFTLLRSFLSHLDEYFLLNNYWSYLSNSTLL